MRTMTRFTLLLILTLGIATTTFAGQTLFTNVKVFDGTSNKLKTADVLVEDNLIKRVGNNLSAADSATVINGGGRTLMPGMIESHAHLTHMTIQGGLGGFEAATWEEIGAVTAVSAREFIMSGFTTVRDMGGMGGGFKRIIDSGDLAGPRIYAAGAYISQTAGHGDLRLRSQLNTAQTGQQMSNLEQLRIIRLADGVPEVLNASRENFANGAVFLKFMAGGGVSSAKDPLHTLQYTPDEISAVVESATNWDSYATTHVYQANGIIRALELGVKCIDHGHFADDAAMKLIKDKDAFLSTNLVSFSDEVLKHPVYGDPNGPQYPKVIKFAAEKDKFVGLAKKYKPKMVFNTDVVMSDLATARAVRDNSMYLHAEWFGNFELLKAMTSTAGQLAQLTGLANPYPGKLGVIEEGAYADILLVEGNPLEDITVLGARSKIFDIEDPRGETIDSIQFIMKDGKIFKNTLNR